MASYQGVTALITSFNKMNKVVSIKSIKCLLDNLITSFKSVPGMKLSDGNFTSNADSITLIKKHSLTDNKQMVELDDGLI